MIRNYTPVHLLLTKLRGSEFEREVLEDHGLFPSEIVLNPSEGSASLYYHFLDTRNRRSISDSFLLKLFGKGKAWLHRKPSISPGWSTLEPHMFRSLLIGRAILGREFLVALPYDYDMMDLEKVLEILY